MKFTTLFLTSFLVLFSACAKQVETALPARVPVASELRTEVVAAMTAIPWGMAFLPDGSLLVTDKAGALLHFKDGVASEVEGLPEIALQGQGGLMDVALHPDFIENDWIYLSFVSSEGEGSGGNTAILRSRFEDGRLTEQTTIYKATPNTPSGRHFGSRLLFGPDGYLYFSIGDRGERDRNPQDLGLDGGKIYRVRDDGRIPEGNPFADTKGAKAAIFSYGHRNPQGMATHPKTGEVWIHEHGPRGGDEINIIRKGGNYGWPKITYGINYSGTEITDKTAMAGMEQPLFQWTPSIAPSGMAFVTSNKYPDWKGSLLVGSLKFAYLERLEIEGGKVVKREKLLNGVGRLRDVRQGPDGFVYIAVEGKGIMRVLP